MCGSTRVLNIHQICKGCEEKGQKDGVAEDTAEAQTQECGTCTRAVKDGQHALQCEKCDEWFHTGCEKISKVLYKALSEESESRLSFYCKECKRQIVAYSSKITKLEERLKNLEADKETKVQDTSDQTTNILEKVMKKLQEFEERIKKLEEEKRESDRGKEEIVIEALKRFEEVRREEADKERRRDNIVMYNVPEVQQQEPGNIERDDTQHCEDIIRNKLRVEDCNIMQVVRLGRRVENKTRPMLVKLGDEQQKWKVVGSSKFLKNDPNIIYKKVRIAPDMTRKEREENWNLREELRRRRDAGEQGWYIKRGKLLRGRHEQGDTRENTSVY